MLIVEVHIHIVWPIEKRRKKTVKMQQLRVKRGIYVFCAEAGKLVQKES